MSTFTDPVKLEWSQDNPSMAKTIEGWRWYLDWENPDEYVEVPAGMDTDGMSIPTRNIFALFNPLSALFIVLMLLLFRRWDGRMVKGFITHDALYRFRTIYNSRGHKRLCSKMEAEGIMLDMIRAGGLKWINRSESMRGWRKWNYNARCKIVYYGLILGGFVAWYRHRWAERG